MTDPQSLPRRPGSDVGPDIPWAHPYRDWSDDELRRGLAACAEHRWNNLRRHIEGEQKVRIAEELAA